MNHREKELAEIIQIIESELDEVVASALLFARFHLNNAEDSSRIDRKFSETRATSSPTLALSDNADQGESQT